MEKSSEREEKKIIFFLFGPKTSTVRYHTAEPGFMGVQPGNGVITWPPVSVCQNVSTIEQFSAPIIL